MSRAGAPPPRGLDLAAFVREIVALTGPDLDPPTVHRFLADVALEPAALEPVARFVAGRYTRHLLHKSPAVEVLALCWAPGSRAPIHGHEGELCWARVEQGELDFTSYRELSRQPLRVEPVGPAVTGGPGYVDGPADIHAVDTRSGDPRGAVSLHVYCRPYDECDIYDLERGQVRRVRLSYDSVWTP